MPQAVTHVLIALIIASFLRDHYINKKGRKSFPLHYVLIAGIAGLLPDFDIIVYWVLNFFGYTLLEVHRTFTHTIFVPLIFVGLAFVTSKVKHKEYKMSITGICLMIALGCSIHIILDATFMGIIRPFYPVSDMRIGLSLINYLPLRLQSLVAPSLDAILLVLWLIYIELKHKISNFI